MAEPTSETKQTVKFFYIKSNLYRVIHADGAVMAPTPNRDVFVSFYSQRSRLPDMTENEIKSDGSLGEEVGRETKGGDGIMREMDIGIVLDFAIAESFANQILATVNLLKESNKPTGQAVKEVKK